MSGHSSGSRIIRGNTALGAMACAGVVALLATCGCGSKANDGPTPGSGEAAADSAWVMFVFETGSELEGLVLNQYEHPTRVTFLDAMNVAMTGADSLQVEGLTAFLAAAYEAAGIPWTATDLEVAATMSFATLSLPRPVIVNS